ncbi:MAG: hypothetical protein H0U27_14845 [Nitrosopumilus sp.]|nr:hypothetical protein [Nitrosopumilus sp.]
MQNPRGKVYQTKSHHAEVIARITEQAKPRILAGTSNDNMGLQRSPNETREIVSFKWRLIDEDGKDIVAPVAAIKNQNLPKTIDESKKEKIVFDIDEKRRYFFYKYGMVFRWLKMF